MFNDDFSFDAPRSLPVDLLLSSTPMRHSSHQISPCTSPTTMSAPQFSITDLAARFASQRLRRESQICYDSCSAYADSSASEADWLIPTLDQCDSASLRRSRTLPQPPSQYYPISRDQRQVNTRLLCSAVHRQDIAALMTRMVEEREQCCITPIEPDTPPALLEDDEGYNSSEGPLSETSRSSSIATVQSRSERRRASDLVIGGACVSKTVRLRRDRRHARMRSAETPS